MGSPDVIPAQVGIQKMETNCSSRLQEFFHSYANILGDLTQQDRRDVFSSMERYSSTSSIWMTILLMGASLASLRKTQGLEVGHSSRGLRVGRLAMLRRLPRSGGR